MRRIDEVELAVSGVRIAVAARSASVGAPAERRDADAHVLRFDLRERPAYSIEVVRGDELLAHIDIDSPEQDDGTGLRSALAEPALPGSSELFPDFDVF